jgi:malate permease and related proteins
MSVISTLVINIIPLYCLIGLGFFAGRRLDVHIHSIAHMLIFIVAPIVTFGAMARLKFESGYVFLPLFILGISLTCVMVFYHAARIARRDNTANLIALGSVSGNTGYFGLPLVIALYGSSVVGIYLLMNVATSIMEVTIGYYLGARGIHSVKESLRRVARLPTLHALWIGLVVNFSHIKLPDLFYTYWTHATGAYVFLGMMIIGIALAKMKKLEFDAGMFGWLFAAKFLAWPVLGIVLVTLDLHSLHLFTPVVHGLILIFCSVPLMANLVAYAAQLDLHPEKAASSVLLSTLFAIIYMPLLFIAAHHYGLM